MIYIGKFLHAPNQQRTQEKNRRHGEFNLIIEAENETAALEKFRQRIAEFRETSDLFEGDCFSRRDKTALDHPSRKKDLCNHYTAAKWD